MDVSENRNHSDAEVWRRFANAGGDRKPPAEVDPNLLAAYLDGCATQAEIDAVEQAMAADPELVETVAELRDLRTADPIEAPDTVLARAKMTAAARPQQGRLSWWRSAAAAAAIVLMSFIGYQLGHDSSTTQTNADAALASAVAPELYQEAAEGDLLAVFSDHNGAEGDLR